jgi:fibronectin type 3 domain-containing protein
MGHVWLLCHARRDCPGRIAADIRQRRPRHPLSNTLGITWLAPSVSGAAGYRILRGTISGGPYELVGEATGTAFSDVMLERDQRYYYVTQAYDASGIRSVYSAETGGVLPLFRIYLPLVVRN